MCKGINVIHPLNVSTHSIRWRNEYWADKSSVPVCSFLFKDFKYLEGNGVKISWKRFRSKVKSSLYPVSGVKVRTQMQTTRRAWVNTRCLIQACKGNSGQRWIFLVVTCHMFPGRCSKTPRAAWTWTGSFLLSIARTAAKSPLMTSSSCWLTSGSKSSPLFCYFKQC